MEGQCGSNLTECQHEQKTKEKRQNVCLGSWNVLRVFVVHLGSCKEVQSGFAVGYSLHTQFKTIVQIQLRFYRYALLRVCPSKNVDLMCWFAPVSCTFRHETIWSWTSRVWVGLCPLDTTKASFSRKTRFWGCFLVLKALTNLKLWVFHTMQTKPRIHWFT